MTYNNQSNYNFKASIRSPVLDMSREICPDVREICREICRLKYVALAQSIQALRALNTEGRRYFFFIDFVGHITH